MKLLDAVDHDVRAAFALDVRAHLLEQAAEVDDLRLARGVVEVGPAAARTAAMTAFSVAPTDTTGKVKSPPVSRLPPGAVARTKPAAISISAPIASSAWRWRSIGRSPIAQPPGSETVASPARASSGPSTRIDARIRRTMS